MCLISGLPAHELPLGLTSSSILSRSTVKDSSVIAVQIFDQRKFKRRDQGFLGVVNIHVSEVIDLELGGHGAWWWNGPAIKPEAVQITETLAIRRDADVGPEEVY